MNARHHSPRGSAIRMLLKKKRELGQLVRVMIAVMVAGQDHDRNIH